MGNDISLLPEEMELIGLGQVPNPSPCDLFHDTVLYPALLSVFPEERIDTTITSYGVYAEIHFPEITLSNSQGESFILKDLYFKILFKESEKFTLYNWNFTVTRTTMTPGEIATGYLFSHAKNGKSELESSSTSLPWSNLCDNMSGLMESMCDFNEYKYGSIEALTIFFFNLQTYLSWESLEGGPYQERVDCRDDYFPCSTTPLLLQNWYNNILGIFNIDSDYNFDFYLKDGKIALREDEYLLSWIENHGTLLIPYSEFYCYENNGEYYTIRGGGLSSERIEDLGNKYIVFKGEKRYFKIDYSQGIGDATPIKVINPLVINVVKETIEFIFNEKLKKRYNEQSNIYLPDGRLSK